MKEEIRTEILYDLRETIKILDVREPKDTEELKDLSNHAIEDVALYKDLDIISITVLVYSLYKIIQQVNPVDYQRIVQELKVSKQALEKSNLKGYNQSIRRLYHLINKSSTKTKEHLQDVMQAARIKKGTALLEKGLSIGQAAGLMGLSNWDLQQYAAKTTALEMRTQSMPATLRLQKAFAIFGVK
jgi:hypothetical protein